MADGSIVPRVTLLVSLLALAGSSVAVATSWRAQRRATSIAVAGAPAADEDVERRVAVLERQVELLRVGMAARVAVAARGAPAATTAAPGPEATDVGQRLARLEQ